MRVVKPEVGSFWYEDSEQYEADPHHDNRRRFERTRTILRPRETGRIVKVNGETFDGKVRIQNVGGRWVPDGRLGASTTINLTRFGKEFKPLPDEHFAMVRYTEGAPRVIT